MAKMKVEQNPKDIKIGPGTLILSSICFIHNIFSCKKHIYTPETPVIYLCFSSCFSSLSYLKEWIQGNCDRANEFSQLFCYTTKSIKLGFGYVFPNLKGRRKNELKPFKGKDLFLFTLCLLYINILSGSKESHSSITINTGQKKKSWRRYTWLVRLTIWNQNIFQRFTPFLHPKFIFNKPSWMKEGKKEKKMKVQENKKKKQEGDKKKLWCCLDSANLNLR